MNITHFYRIARPFLFSINPETAHNLTLSTLRRTHQWGILPSFTRPAPDPCTVMGLSFPNPVGLAAGLDKNGAYIDALATLGFGFIEVGTVTPRAQPGNPAPRMFRLPQAHALINRMGFNNQGVDAFVENVRQSRFYQNNEGVLGLNIGKNAATPIQHAIDDYLICLKKVYPYAGYVTINISSPNTQNLRQLQEAAELDALLSQLKEAQYRLADEHKRYVPIAIKIAPDMDVGQIEEIARTLLRHQIDAVIATNTTTCRDAIQGSQHANEAGGLSGAPVRVASNTVIRLLKKTLGDTLPVIGVGGILCGKDAQEKRDAGAALIQLYTGLIYQGPALVNACATAWRSKS